MTDVPSPGQRQPAPPDIPGWTLLRSIGRGSYGDVWLARGADGTYRAVKVVYRGNFDNDRPYERELSGIRRFEPISRGHPSQIAVFNVGVNAAAGFFYYVMELADDDDAADEPIPGGLPRSGPAPIPRGRPIDPATYRPRTLKSVSSRRGRLPHHECLEIGLALATALDHLHQHGLIHRDIKPSNVIFVGGVPKLADIGLVTDLDASVSYVGTEGFLPPEGPGTAQGDIYSLGKVLYEIGTGRDRLEFPELPTVLGPPGDSDELLELNQVFLKACQNDVRKRYRTARELLADLNLLREGRSIRRARATDARLRHARAALIITGLAAAAVLGANHLLQQRRLDRMAAEKASAEAARKEAQKEFRDQSRRLADAYSSNARQLATNGDVFGALVLLRSALSTDPPDSQRRSTHLQRIRSVLEQSPRLAFAVVDSNAIASARFNAEGGRLLTTARNGMIHVWNARNGRPVTDPSQPTTTARLAEFDPDGDRALVVDAQGNAAILTSFESRPVLLPMEARGRVQMAAFSPTGRQMALICAETNAALHETSSRRARFQFSHSSPITSVAFSPDGRLLATGTADGSVRLWSTDTGLTSGTRLDRDGPVDGASFGSNGRRLLTLGPGGVRLHDVGSGATAPHLLRHDGRVLSASFSPDGRWVITGGTDRTSRIWDAVSGRMLAALPHDEPVRNAAFSPDQRYIATATGRSIQLWNGVTFRKHRETFVHGGGIVGVMFSPDGRRLLTLADDGGARVFELDQTFPSALLDRALARPELLASLSHFLAGRHVAADEQLLPLASASLAALWERLEPELSVPPDPSGEFEWHQSTAGRADEEQHWFAAAFHWSRVLSARPNDSPAGDRLGRARAELARVEESESRARKPDRTADIPARDANASPRLIDLTPFYNAALGQPWLPSAPSAARNDLSSLPAGIRRFNGVEFDVRGVVQLSGSAMETQGGMFPRQISAIPVGRASGRLHFLHGAAWTSLVGAHVGSYVVHYDDGGSSEIKIVFGRHVREWWSLPTQQPLTPGAAVAWEGANEASAALGLRLRLFQMAWANPRPESRIATIDFKSSMDQSAPFLIAITAE